MNTRKTSAPKDTQIIIRTTSEEKEQLKKLAAAAGIGVSEFVIGLALGDELGKVIKKSK